MKTKNVTLVQAAEGVNAYCVEQLVNRIEPTVGSVLTKAEVKALLDLRDTKVTIKRAVS